jgi:hypothetical protein
MDETDALVAELDRQIAALEAQKAALDNKLVDIVNQIRNTSEKISDGFAFVAGGPLGWLTKKTIEKINPQWLLLIHQQTDIENLINPIARGLAKQVAEKATQVERKAAALAAKVAAESRKALLEPQILAANVALDTASKGLSEAKKLAAKLPNIRFPKPGGWRPTHLSLVINGREYRSFEIDQRLQQGEPYWTQSLIPLSNEDRFVRGLRIKKIEPSQGFEKVLAEKGSLVTTYYKEQDISGWIEFPNIPEYATVVGAVVNPPSEGADGLMSLDLQLEGVEANGRQFLLDGEHGVRHARFIRVEYKHRNPIGDDDDRYKSWNPGDRFKVSGKVEWDSDRAGFFELHPRRRSEVVLLH